MRAKIYIISQLIKLLLIEINFLSLIMITFLITACNGGNIPLSVDKTISTTMHHQILKQNLFFENTENEDIYNLVSMAKEQRLPIEISATHNNGLMQYGIAINSQNGFLSSSNTFISYIQEGSEDELYIGTVYYLMTLINENNMDFIYNFVLKIIENRNTIFNLNELQTHSLDVYDEPSHGLTDDQLTKYVDFLIQESTRLDIHKTFFVYGFATNRINILEQYNSLFNHNQQISREDFPYRFQMIDVYNYILGFIPKDYSLEEYQKWLTQIEPINDIGNEEIILSDYYPHHRVELFKKYGFRINHQDISNWSKFLFDNRLVLNAIHKMKYKSNVEIINFIQQNAQPELDDGFFDESEQFIYNKTCNKSIFLQSTASLLQILANSETDTRNIALDQLIKFQNKKMDLNSLKLMLPQLSENMVGQKCFLTENNFHYLLNYTSQILIRDFFRQACKLGLKYAQEQNYIVLFSWRESGNSESLNLAEKVIDQYKPITHSEASLCIKNELWFDCIQKIK